MTEAAKEEKENKEENRKENTEELKDKISDIELERLENKKRELEEIEKRVDKKTNQLKEIVSEVESHGRGRAGSIKETEREKKIKDAKELVGDNFDPFKGEGSKALD